MSQVPEDFVFHQSSLQDYVECERRFQLRHLQRVRWPAITAEPLLQREEQMQQGARFHHMVHQHILGIPREVLERQLRPNSDLARWWNAFTAGALQDIPQQRYPEMSFSSILGSYRLRAKFDLLALEDGRALIVDWKTGQPASAAQLQTRMQTRVYRYVLAAAGANYFGMTLRPEDVEMRYWYAEAPDASVRLAYDSEQFRQDEAWLMNLLQQIDQQHDFPMTPVEKRCNFCNYRSLCARGESAGFLEADPEDSLDTTDLSWGLDIDQIAEIEF